MGERDPAEAMEVLDRLLKFFGGGERRVKGRLSARGSVRLSVPNSERTRPTPSQTGAVDRHQTLIAVAS